MSSITHPARSRPSVPVLLYTVDQVAQSLQLSSRTVENLISSGQLRSVLIGRSRRVNSDDLAEFASRGTAEIIKAGLRALTASEDESED